MKTKRIRKSFRCTNAVYSAIEYILKHRQTGSNHVTIYMDAVNKVDDEDLLFY